MALPENALTQKLRRRVTDARAAVTILGDARTAPVRTLAYADGRRAVRMAFLAGAASSGYLVHLPGTGAEIAAKCGAEQRPRLEAWLRVGLELGELSEEAGQLVVSGRRARAIANDDPVVGPFYRSVAEYYFGPHQELQALVGVSPGRDDLSHSATTISDVSRVTEPLLAGVLAEVVEAVRPQTWLEIGCGSGVHLATALEAQPMLRALAVDLDAAVVADAASRFDEAGFSERVELRVGDALEVVGGDEQFDVVTLLNNIYYFPETERPALLERFAAMVRPGGELVVASQCAANPGERSSIAAAQLDFLLRVQREAEASLPTSDQLESLVADASTITKVQVRRPMPGEPYVVIRGARQ